jgi:hypothetical protein
MPPKRVNVELHAPRGQSTTAALYTPMFFALILCDYHPLYASLIALLYIYSKMLDRSILHRERLTNR